MFPSKYRKRKIDRKRKKEDSLQNKHLIDSPSLRRIRKIKEMLRNGKKPFLLSTVNENIRTTILDDVEKVV